MSTTRNCGPECPISLRPKTTTANRVLIVSALAVIACCLFSTLAQAQYGSLPIGQVTPPTAQSCNGSGWYPGINCYSATITGCTNTTTMNFNFGYLSPSTAKTNGVIVFFNGKDGTDPVGDATGSSTGEWQFIKDYLSAGYEVVQVAWGFAWQQYFSPWPGGSSPSIANVQAGACRPATFMNYVFNNIYLPITKGTNGNPNAGMCAQGASAGSAQVAYSLAYYAPPTNGQWWIDNVELISGPVLSDIAQGCMQPQPQKTVICGSNQWGCRLGTGGSYWSLYPTYLAGPNQSVGAWTNNGTCAMGNNTTQSSYTLWLVQSIVDQPAASGGVAPVFSYPHTAMGGWLCRTVYNPQNIDCTTNFNAQYCPNNSSPQGQIFQYQVSLGSPANYNVYAVDSCNGPEGAADPNSTVLALNNLDGYDAVKQDMEAACTHKAQ
ncbi:MAG: hypothetical protein WAL56_24480 [Candidatus Sulfotelmatobacter sp.]